MLRSQIWISAFIRRINLAMGEVYVTHKGDDNAGLIMIIHNCDNNNHNLYSEVPGFAKTMPQARIWQLKPEYKNLSSDQVKHIISQEKRFDADLWVIEVMGQGAPYLTDDELRTSSRDNTI